MDTETTAEKVERFRKPSEALQHLFDAVTDDEMDTAMLKIVAASGSMYARVLTKAFNRERERGIELGRAELGFGKGTPCGCPRFVYKTNAAEHVPQTPCASCGHRRNSHEGVYYDTPVPCTASVPLAPGKGLPPGRTQLKVDGVVVPEDGTRVELGDGAGVRLRQPDEDRAPARVMPAGVPQLLELVESLPRDGTGEDSDD